jgi:hypothetical protein
VLLFREIKHINTYETNKEMNILKPPKTPHPLSFRWFYGVVKAK